MTVPSILYKNILDIANRGRGDGTIYAYGTAAVPDTSAKTFDLTTINFIADLTEADDVLIGYDLVFTTSGRSYLITDYTAASDVAVTFETPNAEDTGAYTIRKTLYTNDFNVAYPIRNAANGRLYQQWKDVSANNTATIVAALPNFIDDGGFELNSLSDYWSSTANGDGSVSINSSSPILGTYDCLMNMGTTATQLQLYQLGKSDILAGQTYGIKFKARHSGTGTKENMLRVKLAHQNFTSTVPVTFSALDINDDLTASNTIWEPDIADSNAWESATFTVSENLTASEYFLRIDWIDDVDRDDLYIDAISLFPVTLPDTLIIANHSMAGGFSNPSYVAGYSCPIDSSSIGASDYDLTLVDMDSSITVAGESPIYETFTAPTPIYPIFVINIDNTSLKTWEAGEIWLGARWDWDVYPARPITGKQLTVESISSKARGGPAISEKLYQQKRFDNTVELVDGTEIDNWVDFIETSGHGKPFWLRVQTATALGVTAHSVFCRCVSSPQIEENEPTFYTVTFTFEEAF